MKNVREKIAAADRLRDALCEKDFTRSDIEAALEKCCGGWSEQERQDVLALAHHTSEVLANAYMDVQHLENRPEFEGDFLEGFANHEAHLSAALFGYLHPGADLTAEDHEGFLACRREHPHPYTFDATLLWQEGGIVRS